VARSKQYNEQEVIEKAMGLFWRVGYENTSVRMLEKEMGINQFSIYSSFGSKQGVFLESLKFYKSKVKVKFEKLKKSTNGVKDIEAFFYDSIKDSNEEGSHNGCLVTNTYNEFAEIEDTVVKDEISKFMNDLKDIFIEKLRINTTKDEDTILKEANYLLLSKHGLAAAARVNTKQEIEDYIEMTFKCI
jgi:TetR/AcrR family transcriptional repressor of nem operon